MSGSIRNTRTHLSTLIVFSSFTNKKKDREYEKKKNRSNKCLETKISFFIGIYEIILSKFSFMNHNTNLIGRR